MENQLPKKITKYFRIICALVTLTLTCWCLVKLIKNEDVSLVGFVHFNDDEEKPYPSFTICFWNPFQNEVLKTYGSGINTSTYSKFLQGKLWDKRMLNIDYDNVTVSLEDYLHEMGIQYGNFTTRTWSKENNNMRHFEDLPKFHSDTWFDLVQVHADTEVQGRIHVEIKYFDGIPDLHDDDISSTPKLRVR